MQNSKFTIQNSNDGTTLLNFEFLTLNSGSSSRRRQQSGYLLLVLLLSITLLSIAAAAAAPSIANQIKRDREDELIHRGKQYAEAVKRYYTKFHRYPANIDQLVDTNGIRFLRKRYVDPITGKDDWKLVHQGEAMIKNFQFTAGPGIPGGQWPTALGSSPGAAPTGTTSTNPVAGGVTTGMAGAATSATPGATSAFGNTSSFGQNTTTGATGATAAPGTTGNVTSGTLQLKPGVGGIVIAEFVSNMTNSGGAAGSSTNPANQTTTQSGAQPAGTQNTSSQTTSTNSNSSFMSGSQPQRGGTGSPFGQSGSTFGASGTSAFGNGPGGTNSAFGSGQQIGGGAIIGVASTSTKESIREFNDKNHYNEWAFIYDPRLDTRTPNQPGGIGQPIGQRPGGAFGGTQPATNPNPFGGTTVNPPQTPPTNPNPPR